MSERDDDIIEFDFFDDEPSPPGASTEQATQRRPAIRRRGGGGDGPRRGPAFRAPQGLGPLLRLVLLIALAIFLIVILVFWIQSCRSESRTSEYRDYMQDMTTVGRSSEQIARDLNEQLTTPGIRQDDLIKAIQGLTDRQEQVVRNAERVDAPGPLRDEHDGAVQALQFRVSGLNGLAAAFRETADSRNVSRTGTLLAAQAERLVASDVIWDDLFKDPSKTELDRQGVSGVAVPDSNAVLTPDLASERSMVELAERLRNAAQGGRPTGLHGTGIVSTVVLPANDQLTEGEETVVEATSDLAFRVTIQNSGDSQEVGVKVTLTIQKSPEPITQTRTIDVINSGETKSVEFENLGAPPFGPPTPVRVEVQRVPGETNTTNNNAQYPVVFSLER